MSDELHRIAVTGIILREEGGARKYLITKRAPHKTWAGKWTVPGGGLEASDYTSTEATYANAESSQWYLALEKALRREIREEVNLEVGEVQYLLDIAVVRQDREHPALVLSMYCAYLGGEVVLNSESSEYAWIAASEVGQYELIQGIHHEIELVEERLTTKL